MLSSDLFEESGVITYEEETTILEVVEEASTATEEDGTIIVTTESGDRIVVRPTDQQEKMRMEQLHILPAMDRK